MIRAVAVLTAWGVAGAAFGWLLVRWMDWL